MARPRTTTLGRACAGALLPAVVILAACVLGPPAAAAGARAGARALEGRTWTATYIRGAGQVLPGAEATSTARFHGAKVTGSGGVNSYSARYHTAPGGAVRIAGVVATQIEGPPAAAAQERAFFSALKRAVKYRVSGDTLTLRGAGGGLLLTMAGSSPDALTDRTWKAVELADATGVLQPLVAGSEITAVFGTDGRLGGRASVNLYGTTYTASADGSLTVGPDIVATEMAGPPELMAQEQVYLSALPRAAWYLVVGDALWLRDARGTLLARFAAP